MTHKTESPTGISKIQQSHSDFTQFNLSHSLEKALAEAEFTVPTPVQVATIPLGMEGVDVVGCAQTGTGKTAAFLLPLITHLENNPSDTALILGPTREIVHQISEAARVLLTHLPNIGVCSVIGGGRMDRQLKTLAKKPRLVVGTPGRLNDFLRRRKLNLSQCRVLILDEADRMLDMGFAPQIDEIIKFVPKERQTMMFSATMPPAVEKLSRSYLINPKFVSVGRRETVPELLKQKVIITKQEEKDAVLTHELSSRVGTTLVFAETQRRVEKLGYRLREQGFDAETIHGGRTQGQRFRALKSFKDGDVSILVATDVASRGLDIGNITHVINYDLPGNPEDFLHRVGRTARAGKDGDALTIVIPSDYAEFNRIKKYLGDCEIVGEFPKTNRPQHSQHPRHGQQNQQNNFRQRKRKFGNRKRSAMNQEGRSGNSQGHSQGNNQANGQRNSQSARTQGRSGRLRPSGNRISR